jgi:diaminopimelate epimerase
MQVPFTKMHGLGNDFMVLDLISHPVTLSTEQIRQLADRNFGIGFDQLLLVEPPSQPDVDFNYRIFNADGHEVEHCGNGARCFARFVLDKGLTTRHEIRVKTMRGIIVLSIDDSGLIIVDMGAPDFNPAALPFKAQLAPSYQRHIIVNGNEQTITFFAVSVGNPHAVVLVEDIMSAPVAAIGTALGRHADFPQGVNVGFMQILDRNTIKLRVFERGAGETKACGTGACAAIACGKAAGLLDSDVVAHLNGGDLQLHWGGGNESIVKRGPATTVFEGRVQLAPAPLST